MVCREASLEFGQCVWLDQRHTPDERLRSTTSRTTVSASIMLCVIFAGSANTQTAVSFDINGANSDPPGIVEGVAEDQGVPRIQRRSGGACLSRDRRSRLFPNEWWWDIAWQRDTVR